MGDEKTLEPGTPALAAPVPTSHPPAIWFFFWGEFAERSSYYGMRAILFLYLTKTLHFPDTEATPIYSAFKMACYFLPLLGGYIADRILGRYWTIVGFSLPYVLGHFILGYPTNPALFIALALLAGGSGVIKPNISTLMGQTYDKLRPGQERLRSSAFLWFYLSINVGALISQLAMPVLRDQFGPSIAFQFPAWLMVLSLGVFAAGKRHYVDEVPKFNLQSILILLGIIGIACAGGGLYYYFGTIWAVYSLFGIVLIGVVAWGAMHYMGLNQEAQETMRAQAKILARLFGIFGLIVFFWVGYEHNDTLWIAFTRDYVSLKIPGLPTYISPDQLQFINALFVIICVPLFNALYMKVDPDVKIFTPMRKIMAGFLLTAAAIGIMSLTGSLTQGSVAYASAGPQHAGIFGGFIANAPVLMCTAKASMLWIVVAIIVLTVGEVLLYATALELAYAAAPKSMKGMVTAVFLLTNTVGNFINVQWTPYYGGSLVDPAKDRGSLLPMQFFGYTAIGVLIAACLFYFVGKNFERGQARDAADAAGAAVQG